MLRWWDALTYDQRMWAIRWVWLLSGAWLVLLLLDRWDLL